MSYPIATDKKRQTREPALLNCEHKPSCGDWVQHTFTQEKKRYTDTKPREHVGYDEMYACELCGTERMWGYIASSYNRKADKEEDKEDE